MEIPIIELNRPVPLFSYMFQHSPIWSHRFPMVFPCFFHMFQSLPSIWVWINTYENTIFSGMNIHLPAILMWTTGVQGFDTLPFHSATCPPRGSASRILSPPSAPSRALRPLEAASASLPAVAARRECHERRGHCPPRSREGVPKSWLAWLGPEIPEMES